MDSKGCVFLGIVLVNLVCLTMSSALPHDEVGNRYNQVDKHMKITWLEQKLREDIAREEKDLMELEKQLMGNLDMISAKKRQLEIKKRTPVQCLVNIVSCWK